MKFSHCNIIRDIGLFQLVNADGSFIRDVADQVLSVELAHFQALYKHANNVTHEGLKLHPKLKEKDVYPDNFWVQKVSGATHLLSQSSVEGLKLLESRGLIHGTAASQLFASIFNEIFDLFNTSQSDPKPNRYSIKRYEFDRIARFEEIRQHLLRWKSMPLAVIPQARRLSNLTINHWDVTIQSMISCIEFLFQQEWEFIQTRRFNQDNLEVNSFQIPVFDDHFCCNIHFLETVKFGLEVAGVRTQT